MYSLSDLSQKTGIPRSTITRLLSKLGVKSKNGNCYKGKKASYDPSVLDLLIEAHGYLPEYSLGLYTFNGISFNCQIYDSESYVTVKQISEGFNVEKFFVKAWIKRNISDSYIDRINVRCGTRIGVAYNKDILFGFSHHLETRVKNEPTNIYFIRASNNAVKIGVTNNIGKRLSDLQTSHYEELSLVYIEELKDPRKVEKFLHRALSDFHIRGEWFDSSILSILSFPINQVPQ